MTDDDGDGGDNDDEGKYIKTQHCDFRFVFVSEKKRKKEKTLIHGIERRTTPSRQPVSFIQACTKEMQQPGIRKKR